MLEKGIRPSHSSLMGFGRLGVYGLGVRHSAAV